MEKKERERWTEAQKFRGKNYDREVQGYTKIHSKILTRGPYTSTFAHYDEMKLYWIP